MSKKKKEKQKLHKKINNYIKKKLINLLASRCLWFSPCFYF